MVLPILAGIGAVGSAIGGAVQGHFNRKEQENTRNMQNHWNNKQFEQQKEENRITREREDNAVTRRAKDLKTAGINPLIAGGSPAQASAMGVGGGHDVGQAPQLDLGDPSGKLLAGVTTMLQMKQAEADIAKTKQETENLESINPTITKQGEKVEEETALIQAKNKNEYTKGVKETNEMLNDMLVSELIDAGMEGSAGINGKGGLFGVNAMVRGKAGKQTKIFIPTADIAEQLYNNKISSEEAVTKVMDRVKRSERGATIEEMLPTATEKKTAKKEDKRKFYTHGAGRQ